MVERGEIYWLELPASSGSVQKGRRPVLIIQNNVGNRFSPTTIVAAITSQPRRQRYPFHVPFTAQESGLRLDGTVLCEQIQTVDQSRLGSLAGTLGPDRMREVDTLPSAAALGWKARELGAAVVDGGVGEPGVGILGLRPTMGRLEKTQPSQVLFCPPGCSQEAGEGLSVKGIIAAMVVNQCHPSVRMRVDVTSRPASPS